VLLEVICMIHDNYEYFHTMHLIFSIIFALVLTICVATASGPPVEVWNRTYDGEGLQDEGFYVTAAPDGGYVITGYVTTDTGGEDCVLIKTDAAGNMVWEMDYGGAADDRGSTVLPTGSGYIMAGTTQSFSPDSNADAWLIMTSADGTELWNRTYGGDGIEEALSMDNATGGGFILAGSSSSFTDTHIPYLWLVRTDGDGNELWNRTITTLYTSKALDVISTSDGGYEITGTMSSTGNSNPLLVKTKSSGELDWIRWYDLGFTAGITREGHALRQTPDGGYIIAGTMGNFETGSLDGLLIKTDGNGNEEWNHTYGISGPMANDDAQDIQVESDGYVFAGYTTPPGSTRQFWLARTDTEGLVVWNTSFGGSVHDSVIHAVLEPHPGEYVLLGTSESDDEYTDIRLVNAGNPTVPTANFTGSPTSGSPPLLVTFLDLSNGPPTSWYWDFGDNSTTSTAQNPTHTFSQPGSYTIILRATNDRGNDMETKYGYINVSAPVQPPVAEFLASPVSGGAPLSVTFSDTSSGNPTAWNWSFGDGTYSNNQMVDHTYTNPGTYTASLVVWNSAGVDNKTKVDYISVDEGPRGNGITLENGWNFISIPFRLAQGHNTVSVFDGVDLAGHAIWSYDGFSKSWARMDAGSLLEPLDGIWIYSRGVTFVPLQYADDPVGTPPLKQLAKGWNAVGVSGSAAGTARDNLLSVKEGWSQAIGFDEKTQAYETAVVNAGSGAFSDGQYLYPGQGCWLYMRAPGELAGMGV
jgi:PKD repeat protein